MATSRATAYFPLPVEQVWHTVTDLAHTAWRSDLFRTEIQDETHFAEHTKSGCITNFTITACEPPRYWAFVMENTNMSGCWEGIFETAESGTRLICTETVAARHWWMYPFVPGYLKRQQKLYLCDLRKELLK